MLWLAEISGFGELISNRNLKFFKPYFSRSTPPRVWQTLGGKGEPLCGNIINHNGYVTMNMQKVLLSASISKPKRLPKDSIFWDYWRERR
jgi:hypothetical protein